MKRTVYDINLSELEPLGEGKTAAVYALDATRALKVFFPGFPRESVEAEFAGGSLACRSGVPAPRVYELCMVGDRYALVMDRISGRDMLTTLLMMDPQSDGFAALIARFAEIHRSLLAVPAPDAPDIKRRLKSQLERIGYGRLAERLERLPDGEMLCHGDFHPGNVLISGEQPMVIDFMSCGKGAPVMDIARTYYLMSYGARGEIDDRVHEAIGEAYLKCMDVQKEELADAMPVIMAARLDEAFGDAEREVILAYLRDIRA